jgi:hypothetical protein
MQAVEEYRANTIAESGVRAAQEAKADYAWISKWARDELRPILLPIVRDANVEANEVIKQKEDTWPNKIKKASWYIVAIIVTAIVSGIVTYYLALAGFKV